MYMIGTFSYHNRRMRIRPNRCKRRK